MHKISTDAESFPRKENLNFFACKSIRDLDYSRIKVNFFY